MYKRILFLVGGACVAPEFISRIKKIKGVEIVVACDMDPNASGFSSADVGVLVSPATSESFASEIQAIVDKYRIDYVFPFVEFGFEKLIKVNANFGSDLVSGALCKDKYLFSMKCKELNIPVPKTYLLDQLENDFLKFPIYIKPRKGDGSKNNYVVNNATELNGLKSFLGNNSSQYIAQEFLTGQHWAADVVVDNDEVIKVVTRRTLGQVYRVEVKANPEFEKFCLHVQKVLGIKKIFNIEAFEVTPGKFVINEINARAGGNLITSVLSGCDIISYLITKDRDYLKDPQNKSFAYHFERIEIKPEKYSK